MSEFWGASIVAVGFLTLLVLAEYWRWLRNPPAEFTRKLVHAGGGVIALLLPLLVSSHWTVLALASGMGLLFVVSKRLGWLQSVHGISRRSQGAEFYPIVVYTLFLLAGHEIWKYTACILNLAVADALAALIGKRFGRVRFRVADQFKTFEGSLAFYFSSFAVTILPVIGFDPLAGNADRWVHYLLAANLIALLVTCFEAVAQRGQDNLWIPLGALLVLTKTFQTDVADLWWQNLSFMGILFVSSIIARWSRALEFAGVLIFCLASYGCWAMGSLDWALPIFSGFIVYVAYCTLFQAQWGLQIRAVLWSVIVPFAALAIANISIQYDAWDWYRFMYAPFLAAAALALTQAVSNVSNFRLTATRTSSKTRIYQVVNSIVIAIAISCLFTGIAMIRGSLPNAFNAVWLISGVSILSAISTLLIIAANPETMNGLWFIKRASLNATAALIIATAQRLGQLSSWTPN